MKEQKRFAVGIDVGGTNTVTGLVDEEGRTYGEMHFRTGDYEIFDDYIERLIQNIEALREMSEGEIAGIGIGAPSANYITGMAENPTNLHWYERGADNGRGERIERIPFVSAIKKHYPGIPVVMDNDANAAAIGEMIYGAAKGMKDFIQITLGTGVGGGVVCNGQMVYGRDGTAGELGHVIVRPGGRLCGCGRRGCLETYVSATGIRRTMLHILSDDIRPSRLRGIAPEQMDAKIIAEAAREGDELAREAFEQTGAILGEALANYAAITYPEAIFLFGGVTRAGELLFEPVRRHMGKNMLFLYFGKVQLLPSGIDEANAAILGSSALVWQELNKSGSAG